MGCPSVERERRVATSSSCKALLNETKLNLCCARTSALLTKPLLCELNLCSAN